MSTVKTVVTVINKLKNDNVELRNESNRILRDIRQCKYALKIQEISDIQAMQLLERIAEDKVMREQVEFLIKSNRMLIAELENMEVA